jgi:molybdopterin synthase sulfur carrier subunit
MKQITIRYFARLREQLGVEQEAIELPDSITNITELKTFLMARGQSWHKTFTSAPSILTAVNQTMASNTQSVSNGDEVAFFPPVTGG